MISPISIRYQELSQRCEYNTNFSFCTQKNNDKKNKVTCLFCINLLYLRHSKITKEGRHFMYKRIPLGYIKLDIGTIEIHVMHDFFLNYTFEKKKNWRILRLVINIFLEELSRQRTDLSVQLVKGDILVKTQYKYYLDATNTAKSQDFRLESIDDNILFYCEFQNRARTRPPVKLRAIDYQTLSVKQGEGKATRQIWLLAEDVEELLGGSSFASFVIKDEISGRAYPIDTSLTFVSLTKLSEGKGTASELASFLLGTGKKIKCNKVRRISDAFRKSFREFCKDKGVRTRMSVAEKYRDEGIEQGIEQGIALGVNKVAELIKAGYTIEDALKIASGESSE